MIDDNHSPPAMVKKACSLGERASRYRVMNRQHGRQELESYRQRGKELHEAKEQCVEENGNWLKWLKDAEENDRNARRYIRLFLNWDKVSSSLDTVTKGGLRAVLEWLTDVEAGQCRQCRLNPPGKKNCADCKAIRNPRQPGDEDDAKPHLKTIAAAEKFWKNKLEPLAKLKAVPNGTADQAFRALETLLVCYRKLAEADLKPAEPPRKAKCRDCQADILWAGPNEKGKNVPLQPEPGGGSFRLVENRPVYVKWSHDLDTSELYRAHECPARKKT
jgi:hypothetical protein